jgi:hypothetical protein
MRGHPEPHGQVDGDDDEDVAEQLVEQAPRPVGVGVLGRAWAMKLYADPSDTRPRLHSQRADNEVGGTRTAKELT